MKQTGFFILHDVNPIRFYYNGEQFWAEQSRYEDWSWKGERQNRCSTANEEEFGSVGNQTNRKNAEEIRPTQTGAPVVRRGMVLLRHRQRSKEQEDGTHSARSPRQPRRMGGTRAGNGSILPLGQLRHSRVRWGGRAEGHLQQFKAAALRAHPTRARPPQSR